MPEVPLRRVLSVSSEDPRFPASNLLQPDEGGRWLSAKGGEKQISVVLELAEPKPIHSLHIGNCGSAFVEVLVGQAGGDYEVLVPTAAFLSPNESRTGAELKRVRLFGAQSLVKGVAGKSWERLRLVCSQPYCQTRPFGLSFVRVFSPPEDKEETPVRRLGPFTLREEGGSPPRPPGSLFYQRPSSPAGLTQASPGPSYAAAALQSSPKAPKRRLPPPKANGTPPSKQPAPGPVPSVSSPAPKVANSAPKASSSTQKSPSSTLKAPGSTHKALNSTPKAPGSTPKAPNSSPRGSNSTPKAPGSTHKGSSSSPKGSSPAPKGSSPAPKGSGPAPVLGGVVFALSGFENPLRSQLREAALGLGATYSPDWTEACTHLVSAFPRTPKAARARALGGVVVGPSWIWECQKRQRRLPCGPYLLGGSGSASSDTEEEEEEEEPASAPPPARSSPAPEATPPSPEPAPAESPPPSPDTPLSESGDSGNQSEGEDPYGGSTEENSEEEEEEEEEDIPPLPNFFEDKTFFLHGDFPPGEGRLLLRYLTAFGGTLAPYMDDSVTHVVTAQDWDPAFEEALELRPSLTFVRPRWLLLCGQRQRPLPAQPFAVVPNH